MKATKVTEKQSFQPFQISLEFESLDEVKKFYAVFNNPPVAGFVGEEAGCDILDLLLPDGESRVSFASDKYEELSDALSNYYRYRRFAVAMGCVRTRQHPAPSQDLTQGEMV